MKEQDKGFSLNDMLLVALLRDFESMAMVGFGKLIDPVSQKAERNLERAKVAIDMLGMLEEKTKGNLNDTEVALMQQVLTNLRLNYVDELEKEKTAGEASGAVDSEEKTAPEMTPEADAGAEDAVSSEDTEPVAESAPPLQNASENGEKKAPGVKRAKQTVKGARVKEPRRKADAGSGVDGGAK